MMFKRYPYKVRIFQKKGSKLRCINDTARRVSLKDGTVYLELKKMKTQIEFTDYEYSYFDEKGQQHIDYYSPSEDEFYPVTLNEAMWNGKELLKRQPIAKDVLLWGQLHYQRVQKKYAVKQDVWTKLMPFIAIAGSLAMIAFVAIFTYNALVDITAQASGISANFKDFTLAIERILEQKQVILESPDDSVTPPPFG